MIAKQGQDGIIMHIAQVISRDTSTALEAVGDFIKRAKRDLATDCKALEITSVTAGYAGTVASEAATLAGSAGIFGVPAAAVASGVAIASYSTKYAVDIAHIELGCDDIPFNEIKEIMDERFNKVDKALDRNYDAIVKVDQKVDKVLSEVQQTRIEMRQGFNDVLTKITSIEIRQTLSDLKTFVTYFDTQAAHINGFSQAKYISRINDTIKFLNYLNVARTPEDKTLYSIVYQIINRDFANPQNSEDTDAWSALFSLYYAAQTYVSVTLFLVKQYSRIADYYYNDGDLTEYNLYFDQLQSVFENFQQTLAGNGALIDRIVEVMERVKAKKFVSDNKDLMESLNTKIEALKKMEVDVLEMELPIITDDVDELNGFIRFNDISPIEDWISGGEVSYALQYKAGKLYSKIGKWTSFKFQGQANPVLRIRGSPEGKQQLIFRKFNDAKAQLVGVLDNEDEIEFHDINRDLYNAVSFSWKTDEDAQKAIEMLLEKGIDMNARFDHGRTAIHAAAEGGSEFIAKILLEKNPSCINSVDDNGYTPLHVAAERGDDHFIALLIEHHVDVNAQTYSQKLTALHLAARNGFSFAFNALLEAENINVYARDSDGFTPLHLAVERGLSFLQNVLQKGNPEINAKTAAGITLLHMAAMSNNKRLAESLVKNNDLDINSVAADKFTPLHFAVIAGHLDMVQFLLQHGADVNAATSTTWYPLHFAVTLRREDIVTTLLAQENIRIDPRADGSSPFHFAVGTGQLSIARKLLAKGAKIQAITKNFVTPLHIASMHRNLEMVKFLLDNGAQLDAITTTRYDKINNKTPGYTPLLTAALVGNLAIVQYLVEKGAKIDSTEKGGDNVLHIAAKNGHLNVLKFLENHFDVAMDPKVLQSAINGGQLNIVRYLVDEKNMDVNNEAIFDVAVESGHPNIVKYLITEKQYAVTCDNPDNCWLLKRACNFGYFEMVQHLTNNQRLNLHGGAINEAFLSGHTHILDYFFDAELMTSADLRRLAIEENYLRYAVYEGLQMVKYVVERAHISSNDRIRFGLDEAIQSSKLDVIKYLVKDIDINTVTLGENGNTVLHAAVSQAISGDNKPVLRYLVDEKGANVNAKNKNGETALDAAIKYNFQSYPVQFLISRGAVFNSSMEYGNNVNLDITMLVNSQPRCKDIIEGKEVNKDYLGGITQCIDTTKKVIGYDIYLTTPLILAISKGNINLANELLDSGASILLTDVVGNTPLHAAVEHGHISLTNKLIQMGANVTVENTEYKIPLILAYENYNKAIVDALIAAKQTQSTDGNSRSRRSIKKTASPINVVNYLSEHGCQISDASEKEGTPLCLANLNDKQETTEFKNPLCLQHNLSLGLLFLQNFLDKKYPLPRFTEMDANKARIFALEISFEFEKILRKTFKVTLGDASSADSYRLYQEIEANIRNETFSNIPKILVEFVNKICNKETAKSVAGRVGKWLSKE